MERFVKFNNKNTFVDWHLILIDKEIEPPKPKTHYVEIDGMDGSIDLTESLSGGVVYDNRTITFEFWTDYKNRADRVKLLNKIRSYIHGRKMRIIEPDDSEHYYIGRSTVRDEVNNLAYASVTIECECEPYRYTLTDYVRTINVSDNIIKTHLTNRGVKTVIPEIRVDGDVILTFDNQQITLQSGNYKLTSLKIKTEGITVSVNGNGSVTFVYKEADI